MPKPDRVPSSLEAEKAVLGSILLDPSHLKQISSSLTVEYFSSRAHQHIFAAMCALEKRGVESDLITLADEMERSATIDAAGGRAYLASLTDGIPFGLGSVKMVESYREILTEKFGKREAMKFAEKFGAMAGNGSRLEELTDDLLREHRELSSLSIRGEMENLAAGINGMMEAIDAPPGTTSGLATGLEWLDMMTCGLQPGNMVVIAGRPGVGKSSMVTQIALQAIARAEAVGIISLEMQTGLLLQRMVAQLARVSLHRWRGGFLTWAEKATCKNAARALKESELFLNDAPAQSISQLSAYLPKEARRRNMKLTVVDYLQLVTAPGQGATERTTNVSHGLQGIARQIGSDTGGTMVVACQLSRAPKDEEPQLYHLRDSGAIEQDADVVIFIWGPSEDGRVNVKIGKQRNGPTGQSQLVFIKDCMRFENCAVGI